MWAAMSQDQRETAIERLKVLARFDPPNDPPHADVAAAELGMSLNRWYEMHRQWRENRSLSSIGASAAMSRTRALSHHDLLQRRVVEVVDQAQAAAGEVGKDASVRQLVLALEQVAPLTSKGKKLSYNTLRKFVEAELRRRLAEQKPGNEIMFDCCSCLLPHAGDSPFIAFLVLDKATRAILGFSFGNASESRHGYARAAEVALTRLSRKPFIGLDWAERLERSEVVIGTDTDAWSDIRAEMTAAGLRGQLQPSTSSQRFGRYVRKLIGDRAGRVKFLPGKTAKEPVGASATPDDVARFIVEVELYNEQMLSEREQASGRDVPAGLIAALRHLAEWPAR